MECKTKSSVVDATGRVDMRIVEGVIEDALEYLWGPERRDQKHNKIIVEGMLIDVVEGGVLDAFWGTA